ncbi:methanogenesis marker 8 protein [Methanocaldococcus infernus]
MRHVMEALGKAKVIVEDGKVVYVGEPKVKYCPLFAKHRGIKEITKEEIKKNIEFRIKDFGLFTKDRKVLEKDYIVPFGASEIIMSALKRKVVDCSVIVSDCAGTVITNNPYLVQGLCGRISGIIETSPIKEVIEKIEENGGIVLDKEKAKIDQVLGVKKAKELGFKKIIVTVTSLEEAKKCKELGAITFGVHLTGIEWSEEIEKYFDLLTSCASKCLRERLRNIKAQIGKTIPIFALSEVGKEILLERAKDLDGVLITLESLPKLNENQPRPLL